MSNDPKRALVAIHAQGVADFRAQLDAAIAAAQQAAPAPREAALIAALADIVERTCVVELTSEEPVAKAA